MTVACATDGNHGRSVAQGAQLVGAKAAIFVHSGVSDERVAAIARFGAEMIRVEGTYDDSVAEAARVAAEKGWTVVSDTSWPGYEEVPRRVIEGYATIFHEVDEQAGAVVDVAFVPVGVGALAAAAARHLAGRARLAGIEPVGAACMLESIRAGRITEVPGPHRSIMAGLNAGLPSLVAWPLVSGSFDLFAAAEDELAVEGTRRLARLGLEVGECSGGAAGAAATLLADAEAREALGAGADSVVLVLLTEGVTDPRAYAQILA
jgi:diaminopropionate ammonia-lyase